LPVSAHECDASASIEADPEIIAATDFAMATSRLAPKAMMTVRVLSPPPSGVVSVARRPLRGGATFICPVAPVFGAFGGIALDIIGGGIGFSVCRHRAGLPS
jgi:hypothetical protein